MKRAVKLLAMSCFALLVFTGAAIFYAPAVTLARIIELPPQVRSLHGTFWAGQARLDSGFTLVWQASLRRVFLGRLEVDLGFRGPQTLVEGQAFIGPASLGIGDVSGRVGAEVLDLFAQAGPCDGQAVVDITRMRWSRRDIDAVGRIASSESRCTLPGAPALLVPPLNFDLTGEAGEGVLTVTSDNAARTLMGSVRISPDLWARVRIEPDGARLVPGLPASAPTLLEFQLN